MTVFIDAATGKLLAAFILTSTFGAQTPHLQERINTVDQADSWLVFSRLANNKTSPLKDRIFHVFIKKTTAEVIGIEMNWRIQIPREMEQDRLAQDAFYKNPSWTPSPIGLSILQAANGGLINNKDDAVKFARILLRTSPKTASLALTDLEAKEQTGVWSIFTKEIRGSTKSQVLTFSRLTGKVLSGL